MEPPSKRQRLDAGALPVLMSASTTEEHERNTQAIRAKLKGRFESIFDKYERDFTGIGDEIDLMTGEVVVDNGHLAHMAGEQDAHGQALDLDGADFIDPYDHDYIDLDDNDDDDDDQDELASFNTVHSNFAPINSPRSQVPAIRAPVTEQPPSDPKWAAPEIPGLRQPVYTPQVELQDDLLENTSDRSESPDHSVWGANPLNVRMADRRIRTAWTGDELALIRQLKDSGKPLTVPRIHREYMPHRSICSIRLRWDDLSRDAASRELHWPSQDLEIVSTSLPTAFDREDSGETVDLELKRYLAPVEASLGSGLANEDDALFSRPKPDHGIEVLRGDSLQNLEAQQESTAQDAVHPSESLATLPGSWSSQDQKARIETQLPDLDVTYRELDETAALPPPPKVYIPMVPDSLRHMSPLLFQEAWNDGFPSAPSVNELIPEASTQATTRGSPNESRNIIALDSRFRETDAVSSAPDNIVSEAIAAALEEPNADSIEEGHNGTQLGDIASPSLSGPRINPTSQAEVSKPQNSPVQTGSPCEMAPTETEPSVPGGTLHSHMDAAFVSNVDSQKSPCVAQDGTGSNGPQKSDDPTHVYSEKPDRTSILPLPSSTDRDVEENENLPAQQMPAEEVPVTEEPTSPPLASTNAQSSVSTTQQQKEASTPRNRANSKFHSRRVFASPALSALGGDSDSDQDKSSPHSQPVVFRSAEPLRTLKDWPESRPPMSEKRQICGKGGFKCKRSICLRCVM